MELDSIMEHRKVKIICNLHLDQLDETELQAYQDHMNWSAQGELLSQRAYFAADSDLRACHKSYDNLSHHLFTFLGNFCHLWEKGDYGGYTFYFAPRLQ